MLKMLKMVNLGSGFYIPIERIIHIFPASGNMANKALAAAKSADGNGLRVYDCTGKRKKSSFIVVQGGSTGDYLVISPLTAKTVVGKVEEAAVAAASRLGI